MMSSSTSRERAMVKTSASPFVLAISALLLSAAACAAPPKPLPGISASAETGFGYDSNAYQAPSAPYIDRAVGATQNQLVTPQVQRGFFIPYKARLEALGPVQNNQRLLGSLALSGRKYLGGMGNADEFNLAGKGGMTFDLGDGNRTKKMLYGGLLLERHHQLYVDHDSGASKTTATGSNISNRYNYTTLGLEGEFKDELDDFDYSVKAQFLQNDYADPVVVSQLDHSYFNLAGSLDYKLIAGTKLNFSAAHSVRDYSARQARDASGATVATNPLLKYTYDDFGVSLRDRLSPEWLYYLDYDYSQRGDGYVSYNDYRSHRVGGRLLFRQEGLKGRVAFHHWKRDYPNAFAYDVAGQARKAYSGNDLRLKVEREQSSQLSYWGEVVFETQDSSDQRYAYTRKQLMVGVDWEM